MVARRERVTGRRRLLRKALNLAGGLAAMALAPPLARAQTFTADSISQAAQDARRDVGRLSRRADDLLRRTVAAGNERDGGAVRRFRAEQITLARELAAIFNSRVSEDDWLLIVPTSELDLVLTMRPLVIRIAPTDKEVEAALSQPLPRVVPLAGDTAEDELHAIVLRLLGLDRQVALFEVLRNDPSLNAVLKDAATAVKEKRYGLAALEFERLMRAILLPKNVAAIADDLGKDAERRLYKSLVVRFVPFVGWTYFVTLLLAAVYYNRDATAPMFR
ncbi:MAG: hypothetical protein WBD48_10975 [Pseudolabrys sp.]